MAEPRASMFVRTMAVSHVVVVVVGGYALVQEPSWLFAGLLVVIALYTAYWVREAFRRR